MSDDKRQNKSPKLPADVSASAQKTRNKVNKRKAAAAFLLAFALIFLAEIFGYLLWNWQDGKNVIKRRVKESLRSEETTRYALTLEEDYRQLALALRNQDPYRATYVRKTVDEDIAALRGRLEEPVWVAARKLPAVEKEVQSAFTLLEIAEEANTRLADPLIEQMRRCPLSDLTDESGVRVDMALSYMDFAERMLPEAEELLERMENVHFSLVDSDGRLGDCTAAARDLLDTYKAYRDRLPALRMLLGGGSDRLYLVAVQNTAELRSTGGFPGAMGVIRIADGVLTVSDFRSARKLLSMNTPKAANVSWEEYEMSFWEMSKTWNANYSPDFERAACIWSLGYEACNGERPDGVVSVTPAAIQRLLRFLGSITLSDGTELGGDNAFRVLSHDLVYRYPAVGGDESGNDVVDALFAETAEKTLALLGTNAGAEYMREYLNFFESSTAERTLMLWMADAEEQAQIRRLSWAGTLNRDETRPEIGVFFNSAAADKLGWYLDIDTVIGDAAENGDGSKTYPVTVRFSNTLGDEERAIAGENILGGKGGAMHAGMYILGPAGGTASLAEADTPGTVRTFSYQGLDMILVSDFIAPGSTVTVSCNVTTSPRAVETLGVMQTPTAQSYR